MSQRIGDYDCLMPLRTAGSGSARWCIGAYGVERFFIKQFLSPVYPADETTALGQKQAARCRAFEKQKQALYAAISCVIGGTLVPVIDFFRYDGRYYAVSEALPDTHLTAENARQLSPEERRRILFELALCLQRLHTQGVVHADLKPEHALLCREANGWHTRLIDLDSGFLTDNPPREPREMEGDPVYLSPEMYLSMCGQSVSLGPAADTFAFGMMIHRIWTGRLPDFDCQKYDYLYQASLDGAAVRLDDSLPAQWRDTVQAMLLPNPQDRPGDAQVTRLFEPAPTLAAGFERNGPINGLSRFMRGEKRFESR